MKTLALTPDTWDVFADANGNWAVADEPYALAQDVASAIQLWKGEARYDVTRGVPYETEILGKMPPRVVIEAWFNAEGMTVPNVEKVQSNLYYDKNTRELNGVVEITSEGKKYGFNI